MVPAIVLCLEEYRTLDPVGKFAMLSDDGIIPPKLYAGMPPRHEPIKRMVDKRGLFSIRAWRYRPAGA
jgi:hypothetical protein